MLDIILDEFHFASLWNGGIFLFLAFTAIIYLFLLPSEKNHSAGKTILFLGSLVLLFIAVGSPLNIIGRIKFSTHIIQVALLVLVIPPLMLLGLKKKVIHQVRKFPVIKKLEKFITNPIIAFGLFYGFLYAYHHPPIFDDARTDLFWNYFYLLGLFLAAILLWVPIIRNQFGTKQRTIFLLAIMGMLLPLGSIFLFAKESLYQTYSNLTSFTEALQLCLPPGETLSSDYILMLLPFKPVAEQQLGGIIWIVSGLVIFAAILLWTNLKRKS
ncbi:cytochrome c oxidase assembly protein [Ornithinibacillus xuwenensis]|uniref:Cytochrome c oxidase assembly protein n=1 Tax=Ornithinibacillus xuwenensis TaxID=3144668 RepID=A0ABU9XHN5_9BACI